MREKVYEIIKELSGIEDINDGMFLSEDLGFDSLDVITMLVELEERACIEFEASDINPEDLNTVGSIVTLMEKYEV
ncbi:MAG: acyl carrier protein [Clostridia bacterium]|nr:acyl carrier protein [Clostridia bacterium]